MTDRNLTIKTDDGKELDCTILFTYHYEKNNKDYVVFQVKGTDNCAAAIYHPEQGGEGSLEKVETEEEWAMLEELLNDYADNMQGDEFDDDSCAGCQGCGSQGGCNGCSGCGE